jgi:hypothetical protein
MTSTVKDIIVNVSDTSFGLLAGGNNSEKSKVGQRRDKIKEVRPGFIVMVLLRDSPGNPDKIT